MKNEMKFLRTIQWVLAFIIFVKIGGYFSVFDSRAVTQIFKVISRMSMLLLTIVLLAKAKRLGAHTFFKIDSPIILVMYLGYLVLGLASLLWSTDIGYSALQWVMVFESFVFCYLFIKLVFTINTLDPQFKVNMFKIFLIAVTGISVIFLIGSFIDPSTFYRGTHGGTEMRLGGFYMNPNELGMLACIGSALAIYLLITDYKFSKLIPLALNIAVLLMTSSRSSLIGFGLISFIVIMRHGNGKLKFGFIALGVLAVPFLFKTVFLKESGGMEEVMSMTGRLPFWKALLNEGIVKEPMFGFGFMRINYIDTFQGFNTYPGKMTHNTFIQVLMNLGFIGLTIVLIQVAAVIVKGFKISKSENGIFFWIIFIPIIINSFTEFGVFGESNFGILFYQFLIFIIILSKRTKLSMRERIQQNQHKKALS